jgi:hypothetical protein
MASVVAPVSAGLFAEAGAPAAGYGAIVAFGGICLWVLRQPTLAPSSGTA